VAHFLIKASNATSNANGKKRDVGCHGAWPGQGVSADVQIAIRQYVPQERPFGGMAESNPGRL
jgi:hypothetical protein